MLNLAEYRRRFAHLSDFLPWAALIDEGIVLNKDGSLQRTAIFRGPDLDSSVSSELIGVSHRLNSAFRRLGDRWAVFIEAQRVAASHYPESCFPDPASALVEAERKAAFEAADAHFESFYYLTMLYLPPEDAAMGGDWYNLGEPEAADIRLQPLAGIEDKSERAWAAEWIAELLLRQGLSVGPEEREHIWSALNSLAVAPRQERTLTGLCVLLQSQTLKQALAPYCLSGPQGALLDADTETVHANRVQVFEIQGLVGTAAAPAVLSYLFHRLEASLDGRPALIIIDEGWLALDDDAFAAKLKEWLKTLRKANTSVIFATQSLADIERSALAPILNESCPSRIFLPNVNALEPQIRAIYRRFGLNDRQIEILARAVGIGAGLAAGGVLLGGAAGIGMAGRAGGALVGGMGAAAKGAAATAGGASSAYQLGALGKQGAGAVAGGLANVARTGAAAATSPLRKAAQSAAGSLGSSFQNGVKSAFAASGGSSTKGTVSGSSSAPSGATSAGSSSGTPAWAKGMRTQQALQHGTMTAVQAVRSGDSAGAGHSVNLTESE